MIKIIKNVLAFTAQSISCIYQTQIKHWIVITQTFYIYSLHKNILYSLVLYIALHFQAIKKQYLILYCLNMLFYISEFFYDIRILISDNSEMPQLHYTYSNIVQRYFLINMYQNTFLSIQYHIRTILYFWSFLTKT